MKQWASCAAGAANEHLVLGRCWVGILSGGHVEPP